MDAKARLGRWILLTIIVVFALSELVVAALSFQAGRLRGGPLVGRVLLTGWLLWQVWDGAAWARWLLAGLSLTAAVLAVVFGATSLVAEGRPEVLAVLAVLGIVCLACGVGLASPWVGAYQAARRDRQDPEAGAAPDRGGH